MNQCIVWIRLSIQRSQVWIWQWENNSILLLSDETWTVIVWDFILAFYIIKQVWKILSKLKEKFLVFHDNINLLWPRFQEMAFQSAVDGTALVVAAAGCCWRLSENKTHFQHLVFISKEREIHSAQNNFNFIKKYKSNCNQNQTVYRISF